MDDSGERTVQYLSRRRVDHDEGKEESGKDFTHIPHPRVNWGDGTTGWDVESIGGEARV
jgi:hypothetical protein